MSSLVSGDQDCSCVSGALLHDFKSLCCILCISSSLSCYCRLVSNFPSMWNWKIKQNQYPVTFSWLLQRTLVTVIIIWEPPNYCYICTLDSFRSNTDACISCCGLLVAKHKWFLEQEPGLSFLRSSCSRQHSSPGTVLFAFVFSFSMEENCTWTSRITTCWWWNVG